MFDQDRNDRTNGLESQRRAVDTAATRHVSRALIVGIMSVAALLAALSSPAAAARRDGKVELQTTQTAAVTAGDKAWVSVTWLGIGDVDDLRVTVRRVPNGVTFAYPANTGDHSGPMDGYQLLDGELDFTSFQLDVPYGMGNFDLRLEATWSTNGKAKKKKFKVEVPVVVYEGGDLQQVTTEASIASGAADWIEVWYSGQAPSLDQFTLDVPDDSGLSITYPAYRTYTSLQGDDLLEDGESDVARFRLDAATASPGVYSLGLVARYTRAGTPAETPGILVVEITP